MRLPQPQAYFKLEDNNDRETDRGSFHALHPASLRPVTKFSSSVCRSQTQIWELLPADGSQWLSLCIVYNTAWLAGRRALCLIHLASCLRIEQLCILLWILSLFYLLEQYTQVSRIRLVTFFLLSTNTEKKTKSSKSRVYHRLTSLLLLSHRAQLLS